MGEQQMKKDSFPIGQPLLNRRKITCCCQERIGLLKCCSSDTEHQIVLHEYQEIDVSRLNNSRNYFYNFRIKRYMKNQVEQNIDQHNSILRVKILNSLVPKAGLVCLNNFETSFYSFASFFYINYKITSIN